MGHRGEKEEGQKEYLKKQFQLYIHHLADDGLTWRKKAILGTEKLR